MKKHTISVLVENQFGVLARVAGLFSSRAYNINSLTVGETENPDVSRMTIVVTGDKAILEQVTKQLNKLIDIIKVIDITDEDYIDRELVLIRLDCNKSSRSELIEAVDVFKGRIVGISKNSITAEVSGDTGKIKAFVEFVRPHGIKEMVRSGKIAMAR
ncbi:MAG: acetolactate synthase small subunit [bacterium]